MNSLHNLPMRVTWSPGEGTPSMLGDMYVPPFWSPFWHSGDWTRGTFFSSTNTKTIFWGTKTTNPYIIRSFFGSKFHFPTIFLGPIFRGQLHTPSVSDRVSPHSIPPLPSLLDTLHVTLTGKLWCGVSFANILEKITMLLEFLTVVWLIQTVQMRWMSNTAKRWRGSWRSVANV